MTATFDRKIEGTFTFWHEVFHRIGASNARLQLPNERSNSRFLRGGGSGIAGVWCSETRLDGEYMYFSCLYF